MPKQQRPVKHRVLAARSSRQQDAARRKLWQQVCHPIFKCGHLDKIQNFLPIHVGTLYSLVHLKHTEALTKPILVSPTLWSTAKYSSSTTTDQIGLKFWNGFLLSPIRWFIMMLGPSASQLYTSSIKIFLSDDSAIYRAGLYSRQDEPLQFGRSISFLLVLSAPQTVKYELSNRQFAI